MPSKQNLKHSEYTTQSAIRLESLKQTGLSNKPLGTYNFEGIKHDMQNLGKNVLTDMIIELAEPLNPFLNWFGESNQSIRGQIRTVQHRNSGPLQSGLVSGMTVKERKSIKTPSTGLGSIPLKSPPCKRCPALSGQICKCAAKKLNI